MKMEMEITRFVEIDDIEYVPARRSRCFEDMDEPACIEGYTAYWVIDRKDGKVVRELFTDRDYELYGDEIEEYIFENYADMMEPDPDAKRDEMMERI